MDPVAALIELIDSLVHGSTSDAREHFDNVVDWVENGGFMPDLDVQRHERKVVVTLGRTGP